MKEGIEERELLISDLKRTKVQSDIRLQRRIGQLEGALIDASGMTEYGQRERERGRGREREGDIHLPAIRDAAPSPNEGRGRGGQRKRKEVRVPRVAGLAKKS